MLPLSITCTADAEELRPIWRRDFAINVALGGLYSPIAKRRTAKFLAEHTLIDGTPLQPVAVKKSPWPALVLVALFLALRIAGEFGRGPPMPVAIVAGVLLVPYLWGTVTSRSVASVRWREWQPRFEASWREVYAASWPLFALGVPWAIAEPAVTAAAARTPDGLGAGWIAGVLAAMVVSVPLLVRLGFNWQRLRLQRTVIDGRAIRWPGAFGAYLRVWAATIAGVLLAGVLPVALLRFALSGSFTVARMDTLAAVAATFGGIVLVLLLSTPIRAWHEARMAVLTWHGLRVGELARVTCHLDVRAFVRMRTRHAWRSVVTLGRSRPQAIVEIHGAKTAALRLDAAI